jgi:hypothetical protein
MSSMEINTQPTSSASVGGDAAATEMTSRITDESEVLFWTLLRKFETQTLEHYRAHAPLLATADKERLVVLLSAAGCGDEALAASELAQPIETLLRCARNTDQASTLIVQGLLLERLGQAIYRLAAKTDRASEESQSLARFALAASEAVSELVSPEIARHVGTHETLYVQFATVSHDVLGTLDAVGEPVDRIFGSRFGLRFAEVVGEFAADLVGTCTELGMQRRKVVAQLAGASMGL